MDVRAQVSMVFHLDKCIGCHTCSIACKNIWSDRRGTEYMWWNNVETKPGTGYPILWEDQDKYRGGWEVNGSKPRLKLQGKAGTLANLFFNPYLPTIDDYYEPWTYDYDELFNAPEGDDQPTARPVSMITGEYTEITAGPNWDDDLGGSPLYAENDPNLEGLSDQERDQLFELERLVFFYLPRICNHCLNPACVAACPGQAIYKRGEDGLVLVNQDKCRAWRMCISGCPYKKVYFNWSTGKAEKCILCFPRLETGQAPACFHSCVGRIRYLGVLLYDASRIEETIGQRDENVVHAQLDLILDPEDEHVQAAALDSGISTPMLEAARRSPVYRFVKDFGIALPLHPEFRTLPMLFYVPPLLPVIARKENGGYDLASDFFSSLESARLPLRYLARMFAAGQDEIVRQVYLKLIAVRLRQRALNVGDVDEQTVDKAMEVSGLTPETADAIFRLTALPTFEDRFVIPPLARELAIEAVQDPFVHKAHSGAGYRRPGERGW